MVRLDPDILQVQREWEDVFLRTPLLEKNPSKEVKERPEFKSIQFKDESFDMENYIRYIRENFDQKSIGDISRIWFKCCQKGECLACPSGKWKLFAYKMCNNSIFSMLVNFCMLVILISPLLSVSQCYTVNGADAPLQVFVILSCVWCLLDRCLFLFAMKWEINLQNILKSYIPNSLISDNGHYWCIGGILSVLIILINQVVHLFTSTVYLSNLCKGFLVFLFTARSGHFSQIFEGLYFSVRQSLSLLGLLALLVLFWSFTGLCLFRRYDTYSNSFSTFWEALYTCVHSVLSRPTALYRLQPLYFENNFSALYFVLLTLFGDIVFIALITAIGTRNFRDYSARNFQARLKYRKIAAEALFKLYCSSATGSDRKKEDELTVEQFVLFGKSLGVSYKAHTKERAIYIFNSEDTLRKGSVTFLQFVRLLAMLSCSIRVFSDEDIQEEKRVFALPQKKARKGEEVSQLEKESNAEDELSIWNIFSATIRKPVHDSLAAQASDSVTESTNPLNIRYSEATEVRSSTSLLSMRDSKSLSFMTLRKDAMALGEISSRLQSSDKYIHIPFLTQILHDRDQDTSARSDMASQNSSFCQAEYPSVNHQSARKGNLEESPNSMKGVWNSILQTIAAIYWIAILQLDAWEMEVRVDILRRACFRLVNHCISFSIPFSDYCLVLNVFQSMSLTALILLLVQLGYLAKQHITSWTIAAGWFLVVYFFVETVIMSFSSFKAKFSLRAQWVINFLNLFVYFGFRSVQEDPASPWMALVVLASMLRFQQWVKFLPRADVLKAIFPIVVRCTIFYILVIYFFAIIGNASFCNLYNSNYSYSSYDDAGAWSTFSGLLNYNTFASSLYTTSMIAVLSNWSIVMDAGVSCADPDEVAGVYLYFYSLRVSLVWIVIPTLMSFVIQFFIQKLSKPTKIPKPILWTIMTRNELEQTSGYFVGVIDEEAHLYNIALKKKHKPDVMVQLWSASGRESIPVASSTLETQIFDLEKSIDLAYAELEKMNKKITSVFQQLKAAGTELPHENNSLDENLVLFYVAESQIVKEQQDWIALLKSSAQEDAKSEKLASSVSAVAAGLPKTNHFIVAALWFQDAMNGRSIDFPMTEKNYELNLLILSRSPSLKAMLYIVVLIQMLSIFFHVPECPRTVEADVGSSLVSRNALAVFELTVSLLYIVDVLLDIFVIRGRREEKKTFLSWITVRLICSLLIPLSSILTLAGVTDESHASIRSLYPLLLISRDENYKQLMKGLLVSVRNTWMVYGLLLSLLIGFSLSGFYLFHRVETNASHFDDIFSSFAVVVHCFTSAPYSLFVVNPYLQSGISPLFFVLLSYSTEVFCIGLILATGTYFYRSFSDLTLQQQLAKRHKGINSIWILLADQERQIIILDDWLSFCARLPENYRAEPKEAYDLYKYVCNASPLDESNRDWASGDLAGITKTQFFRLCALLVLGARSRSCDSVAQLQKILKQASPHRCVDDQSIIDVLNSLAMAESTRESAESQMEMVKTQRRRSSNAFLAVQKVKSELLHVDPSQAAASIIRNSIATKGSPNGRETFSKFKRFSRGQHSDSSRATISIVGQRKERTMTYHFDGLYRRVNVIFVRENRGSLFSYESLGITNPTCQKYWNQVVRACQTIISAEFLGSICILELVTIFMYVLLIIQLSYFSSNSQSSRAWARLGYFLTAFFLFETVVRIVAIGELTYFRNSVYCLQCALNVLSLVFMAAMGDDIEGNGVFFMLTVLVQCGRLGLMVWIERGDDKLKVLLGVTGRALFLLVSIIYAFGVVSQNFFCGVLSTTSDPGGGSADDDASSWFVFAAILNFNTYPQSVFTMFEVTVLGSWSMVMDAIGRSVPNPAAIYLFFYSFRLLMTLVVLPLLLSFLVRSSIALNDKIKNEREAREEQAKREKEEADRLKQIELDRASVVSSSDADSFSPLQNMSQPSQQSRLSTQPSLFPSQSSFSIRDDRMTIAENIIRRIKRLFRGSDPSLSVSSRRSGRKVQASRGFFSQYNIAVSKQGDGVTFSSIWSADAGAGESLKFLQILALSTQLENLKNNLDYHCELMLLSLDLLRVAQRQTKSSVASEVSGTELWGSSASLAAETEEDHSGHECAEGKEECKIAPKVQLVDDEKENEDEDEGEDLDRIFEETVKARESLANYMT